MAISDRTIGYRSRDVWQCECDGPHFLAISRHVYPEGLEQWLSLYSYGSNPSLWWRIRECWKLLRQNTHESEWCQIYLDNVTAREIVQALTEASNFYEQWDGNKGEWKHGLSDVEDKPFYRWEWNRISWWLRRHWEELNPLVMIGVGLLLYHLVRVYWLK
jgi:hypothetical protein